MRVIFLDFDGVLNTSSTWKDRPEGWVGPWDNTVEIPLNLLEIRLDPTMVERLNALLACAGAGVVLSTSWRRWPDRAHVLDRLRAAGFRGDVVGETPVLEHGPDRRGREVLAWLEAHPEVRQWVALDDAGDLVCLGDRHVRTNPDVGLQESEVWDALDILVGVSGERP